MIARLAFFSMTRFPMTFGIAKAKAAVAAVLGPRHHAKQRVQRELKSGEPELALIPLLADPNCDFIDVGANEGVYAFYALPFFRRVYAVEAHPSLIDPLRRIVEPKGRVIAAALSDHQGVAKLWIPQRGEGDLTTRSSLEQKANPGFALREVEVRLTTIDALVLEALAVMKIDVEGHELAVLGGAEHTLATARPACIVECEERHNAGGVARVFAFFATRGYQGYYLHRGRLCKVAEFNLERLQRAAAAKQVGSARDPDYVNNFIFVHPDNAVGFDRARSTYGQ